MTTASAPGKIILFGEHAVVSGVTALGGAIDLRAKVTLQDLPGKVLIETDDLALSGFSMDLITGQLISSEAVHATRYVSAALRELETSDISVKIESDIPPAAGLGSSAAIVVATVTAINEHLGLGLSRMEIASTAHGIEKRVQNGLGSPMDTALATFGGYCRVTRTVQPVELPQLDLIVGCTKLSHDTFSEVEKVQRLKGCYPDVVEPIFQAIGAISERAVPLIREQDMSRLGELMNLNHGLLEALGVCTRELSELVYAARNAGSALGAKLTGAGGGGCIIALPRPGPREALMAALRQARGSAFAVKTGCEGVRLESDS
jgi:mevalonate kinase